MSAEFPWPTEGDPDLDTSVIPHTHTESDVTNIGTHTHDARYYTESEVDSALSGKADSSHAHTEADISDLGSYLTDAPSDGTQYARQNGDWAAVIGGGGATDHGALTGLGDDDHPQYVLDSGDTVTGTLTFTRDDVYARQIIMQAATGRPGFQLLNTGVPNADDRRIRFALYGAGSTAAGMIVVERLTADGNSFPTSQTPILWIKAPIRIGAPQHAEDAARLADVTDEANVKAALDGATLTAIAGATGDGVLVQDSSAANGLRKVLWENLPGAGGGMTNLSDDLTPQLGGTLDVNGQAIEDATDGTVQVNDNLDVVGNITVSGTVDGIDLANATLDTDTDVSGNSWVLDEDTMSSNSATKVPTQQSVKAYVDAADQAIEGGEARVNTVAASGATETLPAEYVAHKVTMDQNCTFTFPTPTETGAAFSLLLSGAFTPTFPASVDWAGASAPTYDSPSLYTFTTFDGGTTWLGTFIGGGYA